MTDQKKIEPTPEVPGDAGYKVEQFELVCPECKGSGQRYKYTSSTPEGMQSGTCPICKGTGKAPSRLLTKEEVDLCGIKHLITREDAQFICLEQDAKTHSIDLAHEQAEKKRIKKELEKEFGILQQVGYYKRWQSFWEKELRKDG